MVYRIQLTHNYLISLTKDNLNCVIDIPLHLHFNYIDNFSIMI